MGFFGGEAAEKPHSCEFRAAAGGPKLTSCFYTFKKRDMLKLKLFIAVILGVQITGYCQWKEKNISTTSTLTCVDFVTEDTGFVTGGNKIYKTDNGGETWMTSYTASGSIFYEDVFAIDNNKIIAVGKDINSNISVITKTENGGTDWNEVAVLNSSFLKSVFFSSASIGYCSGGGGTILKSTDSGNSWQEQNSGTGANLESIFFVNEMEGIAVGGSPVSAVILKTQDGGTNWNPVNSPSDNNLQSAYFLNQETGYIVGWNGEIMKTVDFGGNWTIQNSVSMTGNLEVIFTDNNTGYIVGGAMDESLIQKTTNGGELWEDISPPQISEGLVSVQFPSFNIGYAVGGNGTVVKTESGGIVGSSNKFVLSNEFKVFPNPTYGTLNIESESHCKIERIRIYDSNGIVIKDWNLTSINPAIDLSNLASNVYYMEIRSDKKTGIVKIIKK